MSFRRTTRVLTSFRPPSTPFEEGEGAGVSPGGGGWPGSSSPGVVFLRRWVVGLWEGLIARLSSWASWRHPVWLVGLFLVGLALLVASSPDLPPPSSLPIAATPSQSSLSPTSVGLRGSLSALSLEPQITSLLANARRDSIALAQERVTALLGKLNRRVESDFVPYYLSFGRRKLEEIEAYNTFAFGWLREVLGGKHQQDTAAQTLMATFNDGFDRHVMTPLATRQALREIGRETARYYGSQVAVALQDLQETRNVSFSEWRRYLNTLPVIQVEAPGQGPIRVSLSALAGPDPVRDRLGEAVGAALESRFSSYPTLASRLDKLYLPTGKSMFNVGSNVWTYYGSYVAYWIVLILLIRSGFIPINLSGALIGWLIWETFVWSTWIALEARDFGKTREQLHPIIVQGTNEYFADLRVELANPGSDGPFQALLALDSRP